MAFERDTYKTETIVVNTVELIPTLKSIRDQREKSYEQREVKFLLVK